MNSLLHHHNIYDLIATLTIGAIACGYCLKQITFSLNRFYKKEQASSNLANTTCSRCLTCRKAIFNSNIKPISTIQLLNKDRQGKKSLTSLIKGSRGR